MKQKRVLISSVDSDNIKWLYMNFSSFFVKDIYMIIVWVLLFIHGKLEHFNLRIYI